jgi:hypothetical protein
VVPITATIEGSKIC